MSFWIANVHTGNSVLKQQMLKDSHVVSLALILGLLLPHQGILYYVNPIVVMLLAKRYFTYKGMVGVKALILVTIVISGFTYLLSTEVVNIKPVVRAIFLLEMIIFFPFVRNTRIINGYIYFGLIFIFISQLVYMMGLDSLSTLFTTLYPYEGDTNKYTSEYLSENLDYYVIINTKIRLGGMFHNPNNCSRYLTLLYAVFLIENRNVESLQLPISIFVLCSILLTGSRTGFFIFTLLFMVHLFANFKKYPSKTREWFLYIAACTTVVIVLFYAGFDLLVSHRSLNLRGGFSGSIAYKLKFFYEYLNSHANFGQIIFGCFDMSLVSKYITSSSRLDSEWGNAIFNYGWMYFICISVFYIKVYRNLQAGSRSYYIILLWMFSSTLLFSYRASFVFLLILSKYFCDYSKPRINRLSLVGNNYCKHAVRGRRYGA